jgi:hypothetical protein
MAAFALTTEVLEKVIKSMSYADETETISSRD